MKTEKRRSRRKCYSATIAAEGLRDGDCVVADISDAGTRLEVAAQESLQQTFPAPAVAQR